MKRITGSLLLVFLAVLLLAGCGSAGKSTDKQTASAKISVRIPTFQGKTMARPLGNVYDVDAVYISVYFYGEGTTTYAVLLPLAKDVSGAWVGTVPGLDLGLNLSFEAEARNVSDVAIFTGSTSQTLYSVVTNDVSVPMYSVDDGNPVVLAGVNSITKPQEILFDDTVAIDFTIKGGLNDSASYIITQTDGGGSFDFTSGPVALTGNYGTLTLNYTAPSIPGTYANKIKVFNSSGDSVETTFNTYVVAALSNVARMSVQFAPVVDNFHAWKLGNEVFIQAVASDDGPSDQLSYLWESIDYSLANYFTDTVTITPYTDNSTGTVGLYVYDNFGSGLTNYITYTVDPDVFPASVNIYNLTVDVSGGLDENLVVGGLINTTNSQTQAYDYGSTVVLTAVPGPLYNFTGWSGACTGTGDCVINMFSDASVTANFIGNLN